MAGSKSATLPSCANANCDGLFYLDDGATKYGHNASGLNMYVKGNSGEDCIELKWNYEYNDQFCDKTLRAVCSCGEGQLEP